VSREDELQTKIAWFMENDYYDLLVAFLDDQGIDTNAININDMQDKSVHDAIAKHIRAISFKYGK
jgi:hypothetical protein